MELIILTIFTIYLFYLRKDIVLFFSNLLESFRKSSEILTRESPTIPTINLDDILTKPSIETTLNELRLSQFQLLKHNYLQSEKWRTTRAYRLSLDNYQCKLCGLNHSLNVHHLNYKSLFNESVGDLVTLCSSCHTERHEKIGYPQTVEEYLAFNDTLV